MLENILNESLFPLPFILQYPSCISNHYKKQNICTLSNKFILNTTNLEQISGKVSKIFSALFLNSRRIFTPPSLWLPPPPIPEPSRTQVISFVKLGRHERERTSPNFIDVSAIFRLFDVRCRYQSRPMIFLLHHGKRSIALVIMFSQL